MKEFFDKIISNIKQLIIIIFNELAQKIRKK